MNDSEYNELIKRKLCEAINVKYSDIDWGDSFWYRQKEWTHKERDWFIDWLADYLLENDDIRNSIMRFPTTDSTKVRKFAALFAKMYGWRDLDET